MAKPSSLAFRALGSNLTLRGLILDARALRRLPGEIQAKRVDRASLDIRRPAELLKQGKVSHMLTSEIRHELMQRGGVLIGKRWELEQRLLELIERDGLREEISAAAVAASSGAAQGGLPSSSSSAASSGSTQDRLASRVDAEAARGAELNPADVSGVRAKYADKMAAFKKRAAAQSSGGGGGGGGDVAAAASEWSMQSGVRDLLLYMDMRGMARALLPSDGERTTEEDEGAEIARLLQVPPFAHVLEAGGAGGVRRAEAEPVLAACAALGLPPASVMILTDHGGSLSAARRAGVFTCYMRKPIDGAPKRLPSDYVASSMGTFKDVVEELNGHSFRDASTEIRASKYAPG